MRLCKILVSWISLAVILLLGCAGMAVDEEAAAPETVQVLNLPRYMGLWHQIAAIPAPFQDQCYRDTTAEYSILESGLIQVINSCTREGGQREATEGRARPNPDFTSEAKLEVTFVKLFDWLWALAGDYWVIGLGPEYEYSLIGHPERKYAWILSRTPSLSIETLLDIKAQLVSQGYDPCRLIMSRTEQQEFDQHPTLCEYLEQAN